MWCGACGAARAVDACYLLLCLCPCARLQNRMHPNPPEGPPPCVMRRAKGNAVGGGPTQLLSLCQPVNFAYPVTLWQRHRDDRPARMKRRDGSGVQMLNVGEGYGYSMVHALPMVSTVCITWPDTRYPTRSPYSIPILDPHTRYKPANNPNHKHKV